MKIKSNITRDTLKKIEEVTGDSNSRAFARELPPSLYAAHSVKLCLHQRGKIAIFPLWKPPSRKESAILVGMFLFFKQKQGGNSCTGEKLTLNRLIWSIRQSEEITQMEFAKKLGISTQTLVDIEHNVKRISCKSAAYYANQLGYSSEQFVRLAQIPHELCSEI